MFSWTNLALTYMIYNMEKKYIDIIRKFLIDLILVIIPIVIYAIASLVGSIQTTNSKADLNSEKIIGLDRLYKETIINIDHRLERIENKLDKN